MNIRKFEDIELYINLKNEQLVSQNADVEYKDNTLYFNTSYDQSIAVYHELDQEEVNIKYVFKDNIHVDLIEVHDNAVKCTLNREFSFGKFAKVAIFSLDDCNQDLVIKDHGAVEEAANVECAYGELSLANIEAYYEYDLNGEACNMYVRNAVLSSDSKKKHYHVTFNHNAKMSFGQMDNYGVVKDASTLYIDGVGRINRGYSGSATHQTNKIIVFDEGCKAMANPYLYIDEYDVNASHAAGVGKMDEEHLFYLESRGLSRLEAMKLITYGYLMPCVNVIKNETVKEAFAKTLAERMGD